MTGKAIGNQQKGEAKFWRHCDEASTTMQRYESHKQEVELSNNQPDPFDEESVFQTSMNRVSIPRSMVLEDSRDVNSGIAVDTLQKTIIISCLHVAHPTPFQFRQSIFLK